MALLLPPEELLNSAAVPGVSIVVLESNLGYTQLHDLLPLRSGAELTPLETRAAAQRARRGSSAPSPPLASPA